MTKLDNAGGENRSADSQSASALHGAPSGTEPSVLAGFKLALETIAAFDGRITSGSPGPLYSAGFSAGVGHMSSIAKAALGAVPMWAGRSTDSATASPLGGPSLALEALHDGRPHYYQRLVALARQRAHPSLKNTTYPSRGVAQAMRDLVNQLADALGVGAFEAKDPLPTLPVEREAVARVIDPIALDEANVVLAGGYDRFRTALAKADSIIALFQPALQALEARLAELERERRRAGGAPLTRSVARAQADMWHEANARAETAEAGNKLLREALEQADLQLNYLHERFKVTGPVNVVLAKLIDHALSQTQEKVP